MVKVDIQRPRLTPDQVYARLLRHPAMQGKDNRPPSLRTFRSWDREKQEANLSAFRHLNPGIYAEAVQGRKMKEVRLVETGKDIIGRPFTRPEIVWGEPLDTT